MNNKTLLIVLGIAVVALVATLIFSGGNLSMGEGEDPAAMMAQQRGRSAGTAAESAVPESAPSAETAEAEPGDAGAAGMAGEAAEDEPMASADETASATEEEAAEDTAMTEEEPVAEDAPAEAAAEEDADAADDDGEAGEAADEEAAPAEDAAGDEDLMAEPELPEDPIERFKQMDPREIIKAKYRDLEGRLTHTTDEEHQDYIPQTGRVDPLTRVNSAVPDDLKPPRSGETDENQIQIYLGTVAASQAVQFVADFLNCHNVIQIGLSSRATFSFPPLFGDQTFSISEGSGFGLNANGVPVTIRVVSIDSDSVSVQIAGAVSGADGEVTKNQEYIPRAFYH